MIKAIASGLRSFGPYVLVELLVPGGTFVALLMWLIQQRRNAVPHS